jgi:hypothetical protein
MHVVTVQLQTMIFTVIYGSNRKTFDPLYGIIIYDHVIVSKLRLSRCFIHHLYGDRKRYQRVVK